MTGGKPVGVEAAIELGIVDRRIDGNLREGAIGWARELAAQGEAPRRVRDLPLPPSRPADFEQALNAMPDAPRRLPAPPRIVEALASAAMLPFETALARARTLFVECQESSESRALRHLFFAERGSRARSRARARGAPGRRARRRHHGRRHRDQPRYERRRGHAGRYQGRSARSRPRPRRVHDRLRAAQGSAHATARGRRRAACRQPVRSTRLRRPTS